MKKLYLIWLMIYFLVWALAFREANSLLTIERLLSVSLFFIMLFILPLFEGKRLQTGIFCMMVLAATAFFYPYEHDLNPYVLLIQVLIIAEAVYYLPRLKSYIVIVIQVVSMLWLATEFSITLPDLVWASTFYLLTLIALFYFQSIMKQKNEVKMKYDALLDEYRKMKRQLVIEEEQTRQDERMMIGHEIHDSVGHNLTALLVQFEAFRLTAAKQDQEKIEKLKTLAEQSLEETRRQ
ncbi:histidine kinase [Bacillus sp. JCM 19034]|uniref:histidine kinase n=1 Tax=Bacillus sp. JCM 19034 TaxID=1481928 RepID=UPI000AD34926|nr:histidine kinase [Bacillus sp. JCM 19034]